MLLYWIAYSKVLNFMTYRIGAKISLLIIGASGDIETIVGST